MSLADKDVSEELQDDLLEGEEELSEHTDEPSQSDEPSIEDIARANGWKPESEWKGNPPRDGFKTAADFVKDGFKIQQTQHEKIDRLEGQLTGISKKMEEMSTTEAKRLSKALSAQAARLKQERNEAIEDRDTARFEEIDQQLRETEEEIKEVSEQSKGENAFLAGEKDFKQRNTWFENDKTMTAFTYNIAGGLRTAYPDMTADEYYSELEKAVKEQFPNKFTNPRREAGSSVEGGSPAKSGTRKKGFDSLPVEAKQAFEEVSFYNKKMTKQDYAKAYYEMEKD